MKRRAEEGSSDSNSERREKSLAVKYAHEQTPVSAAAEQGCSRVVRELVKVKGLDLDSKDVSGKTALDYAREADVTGYDSESYDLIMAKLFPVKQGASLIREGTLP